MLTDPPLTLRALKKNGERERTAAYFDDRKREDRLLYLARRESKTDPDTSHKMVCGNLKG